jgi:hypothetical protein
MGRLGAKRERCGCGRVHTCVRGACVALRLFATGNVRLHVLVDIALQCSRNFNVIRESEVDIAYSYERADYPIH